MRIGLDARLNAYRTGGIPNYTYQLLAALASVAPDDTFVALQHIRHKQPLVQSPNVVRSPLCTPPHHRLEAWSLPVELLPQRLDVFHCPDFIIPRRCPCAAVVTIHDLAFLRYPDILDDSARRYYGRVRESVWNAEAIIAVSRSTQQDITEFLALPPERITVVYEAAAPAFAPLHLEAGSERTIYPLPHQRTPVLLRAGTFGLFVSTLEPRKNLPTLLRALRVCLDRRPATGYHLVVAGARGWRDKAIFQTLFDLRLYEHVTLIGNVSQEDLRWLYNACVFYANPSLYEGFGLPVLEALACGAPALVSSVSSLPEIAGDAALLLPPTAVDAWADAIEQIWHHEALQARLAQRGPPQASRFSWEQAARETLAVYRTAARNR